MTDTTYSIRPAPDGQFELVDTEGKVVRSGLNPKRLSDWALWDMGAKEVRWDFDLKLVP